MTSYAKARQLMDEFGRAFGVEARQRGFKTLGTRRWIRQEATYSISFGLQKSQWSPFMYVNCGLVYEKLGGSVGLTLPRAADLSERAQVFLAPGARRALNAASDFTNKVKFEARLALIPKIFDAVIKYAESHPTPEKFLSGKRVGMLTRRLYEFDEKRRGRAK